ncbi:hypothetical protein [Vibrio aestuarianus]|uniref:hypothetical protein n=1 Tax=Vibrio aestuarianus TaxID=28171 RepID=UPI00237C7C4E|nr:hypothetical protein [Vibrio aestuarianus]MDE1263797.1 hypothetical protein [Vibrio aestuarianus]MDE1295725.1 hypothetical protein [Vibrio aestuarianus]
MRLIYWVLLVLGVTFLAGCANSRHVTVLNDKLSTNEKISILEKDLPISYLGATESYLDECDHLIECAIYKNDYELTKWLLNNTGSRGTVLETDEGNVWYYKHIIYAPLRYKLSDEDASKFLELLISHGFNSNSCDYGSIPPISYAYKKDYIKSFKVLLDNADPIVNWKRNENHIECAIHKNSEVPYEYLYKAYHPVPINYAIEYYNKNKPNQLAMISMLLDASLDPTKISGYFSKYRCVHYSAPSAMAFASCHKQYEVYSLLSNYYLTTDKLTKSERDAVFKEASYYESKTLSDAELRAKNAEVRRLNREYEAKLKAQMEAEYHDSPALNIEFKSVSEQLGVTSTASINNVSDPKNSSNSNNPNSKSVTKNSNSPTMSREQSFRNFVSLLNTVAIDRKFTKRRFELRSNAIEMEVQIRYEENHVMRLTGRADICTDIAPYFDGGLNFNDNLITAQATKNGVKSRMSKDRGISFRYSKSTQETLSKAYAQVQAACK